MTAAITRMLQIQQNSTSPSSMLPELANLPEEEIWLAKQQNPRTRRAYRLDVQHFMTTVGITTPEELRRADHRAVIAWVRIMREREQAAASTIRRRLAALSSLFAHLVSHGYAAINPVRDVERPITNREEGSTAAFSSVQARQLLDAPPDDTLLGLRDRAILSVGLQVGLRRAEIAALSGGRSASEPRVRLDSRHAQGRPTRCARDQSRNRSEVAGVSQARRPRG